MKNRSYDESILALLCVYIFHDCVYTHRKVKVIFHLHSTKLVIQTNKSSSLLISSTSGMLYTSIGLCVYVVMNVFDGTSMQEHARHEEPAVSPVPSVRRAYALESGAEPTHSSHHTHWWDTKGPLSGPRVSWLRCMTNSSKPPRPPSTEYLRKRPSAKKKH